MGKEDSTLGGVLGFALFSFSLIDDEWFQFLRRIFSFRSARSGLAD
jgi:hypothetical protein